MAASGNVTLAQDGTRLHPYLVALVRWCISSFWSTASILIHRLLTTPLPPIAATKPPKRPASSEHLHPEPRVDCVVLHQPANHEIDVIFVHGLYGSLGNTWKQGEWRSKYKDAPQKQPLRRHSDNDEKPNLADTKKQDKENKKRQYTKLDEAKLKNELKNMLKDIDVDNVNEFYEDMKRILPNENMFITEKFYNNTLLDQVEIVGNYESQADFVRDLFKSSNEEVIGSDTSDCQCVSVCEVGCGCVCDKCYSTCWPRDWIKLDYPGARIISINYTSDPYLWRPLWIKEIKRLRLHERAEQMTSQLLDLGVGEKPIIWVGHSKGGLFIKQIYCEAYDAYMKITKENEINEDNDRTENEMNENLNNEMININCDNDKCMKNERLVKNNDEMDFNEEHIEPSRRSSLYQNSLGFMFYSVPHRGSPLADIKTPITARSIELLEICNNCSLLLTLQERWLTATQPTQPAVRSLVETCRTLMSVLWLRIVSVDSADPGRGALYGVSVDHREICKPTSRNCLLYTELMHLMSTALCKK
ncbi:uncharacterized protein LOC123702510 isoform X2 [Colias croceus]|uniref:uncharacterized protein LOC123702510 isoform X2 n=1 Tax=Colias crocea TaxID=72248 RepID=UPI001E27A41D|nr:uncharacterized protein LOC123702510 isoform X2 [Colias croceus]